MEFMKYERFKEIWKSLDNIMDRHLLTFLYFTGARPAEAMLLKREDIKCENNKLNFRVTTLKRSKKKPIPDTRVRFIEWTLKYDELIEFWRWVKELPNDFYIFGKIRMLGNPREYIRYHLKRPAYFFRHNLFSMVSMAGASRTQIRDLKGAKDERSIEPYLHLSEEAKKKTSRILTKAIE